MFVEWPNVPSETLRETVCVGQLTCAWRSSAELCWKLFFRPSYKDNAWACPLLSDDWFLHVFAVALSHQSSAWDPITPFPSIRLLAIEDSYVFTHADATEDYFGLCLLFFSKDRSRVWLMSRLSWTGWLASKTPWFPLTTYHRRQKMKREGNKYSCFVHYINTCTFEHKKKIDQIPNVCQSSHIVVSSNEFWTLSDILVFWWDGKRVYGSVVERTGGLTLFVSSVPL